MKSLMERKGYLGKFAAADKKRQDDWDESEREAVRLEQELAKAGVKTRRSSDEISVWGKEGDEATVYHDPRTGKVQLNMNITVLGIKSTGDAVKKALKKYGVV